MKKYLLSIGALAMTFCLTAQEVKPVGVMEKKGFSIEYTLPKTAVRVVVTATKTETTAGAYAPYADKFLGISNAPQANQVTWQIEKTELDATAVPDTSRRYQIVFNEKGLMPTMYLSSAGSLVAVNAIPSADLPASPTSIPVVISTPLKVRPQDMMNEEILNAGSAAKRAELVSREIFSIRESRQDLLRGEAATTPPDGVSLKLMLDNLDSQEQSLLSLFQGETTVTRYVREFIFIPSEASTDNVLFRFSSHYGFVDSDDLSGAPYYMDVKIIEDTREIALDLKKAQKGIAYCEPGRALVTLRSGVGSLAEKEMKMSQFGRVNQLPINQFTDKKAPSSATFSAITGAIQFSGQENNE